MRRRASSGRFASPSSSCDTARPRERVALCECGQLADRPRHADRVAHGQRRKQLTDGRPGAGQLDPGRRVAVHVALRQADGTDVEARREGARRELGRAAADVEQQRRASLRADPAPCQLRLLFAGEQLRLEAVRPLDLAQERFAVLGIAHGARGDRERPLGAERLELLPEIGEDVAHAGDRNRQEPAPRVDAFAEARDDAATNDLLDAPLDDVGDEQAGRVRAEVDRGDARHLRGTAPRTSSNESLTSAAAARRTARRASETCRRSAATVSRSV